MASNSLKKGDLVNVEKQLWLALNQVCWADPCDIYHVMYANVTHPLNRFAAIWLAFGCPCLINEKKRLHLAQRRDEMAAAMLCRMSASDDGEEEENFYLTVDK
jgi:hypothetical protein